MTLKPIHTTGDKAFPGFLDAPLTPLAKTKSSVATINLGMDGPPKGVSPFAELVAASCAQGDGQYIPSIPRELLTPREVELYDWVMDYQEKYGVVPPLERLRFESHFTSMVSHVRDEFPLEEVRDYALTWVMYTYSASRIGDAWDFVKNERQITNELFVDLETLTSTIRQVVANEDEKPLALAEMGRDDLFEDEEQGASLGFPILDEATGGVRPGEVATMAAKIATGKSLYACYLAVTWALEGRRVVFASCEMMPKVLRQRIEALLGHFNPILFRSKSKKRLKELKTAADAGWQAIRAAGGDIIILSRKETTLEQVAFRVDSLQPDALIIDGLYLMTSNRATKYMQGWQTAKLVIDEIKQVALDAAIPVFATTQFNRNAKEGGYSLDDIGYSDAFGQDSDIVLAMVKADVSPNILSVQIKKHRNGVDGNGVELSINWEKMTITETSRSVISPYSTPEDVEGDEEDDDVSVKPTTMAMTDSAERIVRVRPPKRQKKPIPTMKVHALGGGPMTSEFFHDQPLTPDEKLLVAADRTTPKGLGSSALAINPNTTEMDVEHLVAIAEKRWPSPPPPYIIPWGTTPKAQLLLPAKCEEKPKSKPRIIPSDGVIKLPAPPPLFLLPATAESSRGATSSAWWECKRPGEDYVFLEELPGHLVKASSRAESAAYRKRLNNGGLPPDELQQVVSVVFTSNGEAWYLKSFPYVGWAEVPVLTSRSAFNRYVEEDNEKRKLRGDAETHYERFEIDPKKFKKKGGFI